ncbi:serine palmitoyltransferase small subunit A [Lates japonicus]|uniref:Serine palmitoyltransferase small subunit A n=1 Tax=Lates japonicus TaxID=270547 RepID=A0AAD3NC39_LATJO|nr:serine palmitoyltransferase small subunit A [Lates japonicus]
MALGDCWKQLSWFYYQYLLVTALYMLEPWERTVFNSLLISVAGMAVYTGYVFMPQHIMAILHYFESVSPPFSKANSISKVKALSIVLEAKSDDVIPWDCFSFARLGGKAVEEHA